MAKRSKKVDEKAAAAKDANAAVFRFAENAPTDKHYASALTALVCKATLSGAKLAALVEIAHKHSKIGKRELKKMFGSSEPPNAFLQAFVWVGEMQVFIHRETGREYNDKQFDRRHAAWFPIRREGVDPAHVVFINHKKSLQADGATYSPGGAEFIDGAYNLWRPSLIKPTEGDITPWMDHAENLIPDKHIRETFFDRMAFDVQHPDQKPNWHLFLGGKQGIGKNTFLEPIIAALGQDNCRTIAPDVFKQPYGDWLQGRKAVFIDEMMSFERTDINNRIKPYQAAPPHELFINKKYGGTFDLPNLLTMYFGSNRQDAMELEESDRRMFLYWSDAEPMTKENGVKIWDWLGENVSNVVGFLARRDLSGFNAKCNAPMTAFKQEVIDLSRSPLAAFLLEAKEARTWPLKYDLVSLNRLVTCKFSSGLGKVNTKSLAKALKENGGGMLTTRPPMADGTRPTLWAVRSVKEYQDMKPPELVKAWDLVLENMAEDERGRPGTRQTATDKDDTTPF